MKRDHMKATSKKKAIEETYNKPPASKALKNSREDRLFSNGHGDILLALARDTIAQSLGLAQASEKAFVDDLRHKADRLDPDKRLDRQLGTFVTLHRHGALRGCIGSLEARESVWEGVIRNALNAAFHDPRFPALTQDEFDSIDLEVSVLSESVPLEYTDAEDLLSKLAPHRHGVTIKKGTARATFLPQVWKQLPDKESFLSHLCQKAGLMKDAWQRGDLAVETYTVQCFEESGADQ